ncbi:MAG: AsmA family protein [Rhodospirillaceae bacterium]|nr:AsmA family protein [Rhodospirillaceae bacterium]
MRNFFIGVGAAVVLLVAAALIAPSFVDWNDYKRDITTEVQKATGRDLVVDGDLDFSILPSLRLTVKNARFANIKGGSSPDMAKLKALDIQVRLLPLLQGRVEAEAITLVEPEILLERLADGRVNWEISPPEEAASTSSGDGAARDAGSSAKEFQLDNLRIRRGTLIYRDARAGTEERVAGLTVQIAVQSLNGPFRAKGDVILRGIPLNFEAGVGELKPTSAAPVTLLVAVPAVEAKAELSGGAVIVGPRPRFTGKLNVSGPDMRRLFAVISDRSRTTLPRSLAQPFLLKAKLKGTEKGGSVDDLEIELGGARASGAVTVKAGDRVNVATRLRISRVDLDAWLKKSEKAGGVANKITVKKSSAAGPKPKKKSAAQAPFSLPDLDGTLNVHLDAITYNRQNARNINLKASLARGQASLDRLAFQLPGGGAATFSGILAAKGGRPAFRGKIDGHADNLRSLLGWMGVDVKAVPASRLRKFAFSAEVTGDDQQVQVLGAKISVDTTRIDGGVTVALRDRPAFGATINVGSLDLDAYKPRTTNAVSTARPASSGAQPSGGTSGQTAAAPLSPLNDFDANLRVRVDRLTVGGIPMRNLRYDGTLVGGVMTIRKGSVGNIGGARASISGTLRNFNALPIFKGSVSADAKDISGLMKLAGMSVPSAARSLGALRLRGKADGSADRVKLDVSLAAAGATVKLAGTAAGFAKTPRVDATVSARHKNLARLLRTLGVATNAGNLSQFDLSARLKGGFKQLSTSLRVKAAGGSLSSTGTISNLAATPLFSQVIAVSHPSVGKLARRFAPDYRPIGGKIGPLRIDATIKGSQSAYTLSTLSASAGRMTLKGNGRLSTKGPRPILTAVMTAGELNLNPFLPPERKVVSRSRSRAGAGRGGRSRGRTIPVTERYSTKPFDMSGLGIVDANLSVGASALVYRQFRVDRPTIKATLTDSLLTVKEIAGKMFDGSFLLAGKLNARRTPTIDGTVTVQKANVGKALFQAAEFDLEGGITDFSMQVAARGTSPRAMVSALDGSGKLQSVNGAVKGFNLKAVSDRLKNLDRAIDFLSLFSASMDGGKTRFLKLNGTFQIRKGVLRSNNIQLLADAGEGRATGFANLPQWQMDFNSQFRLTEHPNAPSFGMRAVGQIDNPRRIFKFEQLQSYLLQRGIGTLLRKVFPGSRRGTSAPQTQPQQDQPQQPAQQQQPRKPRLEDILPGLLKGLGR